MCIIKKYILDAVQCSDWLNIQNYLLKSDLQKKKKKIFTNKC